MRSSVRISLLGAVLSGLGMAACAGLVGADFNDVHALEDAGTIAVDSSGVVIQPTPDAAPKPPRDAGPIIVADGGTCPTGLTACPVSGVDTCVDLSASPDHCHACGTACPSDPHGIGSAVCTTSGCTYSCGSDVLCPGGAGCCPIPVAEAGADTGTPTTLGIPCAKTTCSPLSGGFCCGANNDTTGDICGTAENANDLNCDYEFFCGSAEECGTGTICCYDDNPYDPQGDVNGKSSLCQATCNTSHNYIQFCDPTKTGECLTGTCTEAHSFTGDNNELQTTYYFCQ